MTETLRLSSLAVLLIVLPLTGCGEGRNATVQPAAACEAVSEAFPDYGIKSVERSAEVTFSEIESWFRVRSEESVPAESYDAYRELVPQDRLTVCVMAASNLAPPGPPSKDRPAADTLVAIIDPEGAPHVDAMGPRGPLLAEFDLLRTAESDSS
ncbi:MAG: hypothetical protein ABI782_05850 [Anaerolineaceae bacterium]